MGELADAWSQKERTNLWGVVPGPGLRLGTAFDTGIGRPQGAARRLQRWGLELAAPAESFFVSGVSGLLLKGELDRAREWGETLTTRTREMEPA